MSFGIALAGGGVRGAAHVGVLKALEEAGLRPSSIAGASAGSIVASLYALGFEPDYLWDLALELQKHGSYLIDPDYYHMFGTIARFITRKPSCMTGLLKGKRFEALFHHLTNGKTIRDTLIKTVIPSVDLHSGDTIAFTSDMSHVIPLPNVQWKFKGELSRIVHASCAVPAVFRPVCWGDMDLVDGGVTDVLPVNLLKATGETTVLAVDLDRQTTEQCPMNIIDVAYRSLDIMENALKDCTIQGEKYLLLPDLPEHSGLLNFSSIQACMEAGYEAAKSHMEEIKAFVQRKQA